MAFISIPESILNWKDSQFQKVQIKIIEWDLWDGMWIYRTSSHGYCHSQRNGKQL